MRRRDFLGTSLSGLAAFGLGNTALGGLGRRALAEMEEAPEAPFSRAQLVERARALAGEPYTPPEIFPAAGA